MAAPTPPKLSQISNDLKDRQKQPSPSESPLPGSELSSPAAKCIQVPQRLLRLEPREPLYVVNDDPAFDVRDAAVILNVSVDLLEKWRQRGQGPVYFQYGGPDGPVRYAFSELNAFKAASRVEPSRQPRPRRAR